VTNVHGTRVKAVVHSICNVRLLASRLVSSLRHRLRTGLISLVYRKPQWTVNYTLQLSGDSRNVPHTRRPLLQRCMSPVDRRIRRPSIVQITATATDTCSYVVFL